MIEDTLKLVKGNYKKIIVQVEILQKVDPPPPFGKNENPLGKKLTQHKQHRRKNFQD